MIKKITIVILLVSVLLLLCGCDNSSGNPLAISTSNTKAHIRVDEKTIVIDIDEYIYGSNGVVTIYGSDGTTYRTHSTNVVLVKDAEGR